MDDGVPKAVQFSSTIEFQSGIVFALWTAYSTNKTIQRLEKLSLDKKALRTNRYSMTILLKVIKNSKPIQA